MTFRFADPLVLLCLVLLPLMVFFSGKISFGSRGSIRFSDRSPLKGVKAGLKVRLARNLIYLRALGALLVILALARPQTSTEETKIYVEGIDIVLAVDVSGSMKAMDFEVRGEKVDRLRAVKDVVSSFIDKRPNDRIGIVVFAGQAYTLCPLTLDHDWLEKNLERAHIGMIEDGTAVGSAISASLNRIKDTETKEKIIILLTDGRNNAGRISPVSAAEAAKALGVRVYTIGAGTKGLAPYPVKDMFGNTVLKPVEIELDEKLLKRIADITGAMYFRATDTASLKNIYGEIDKLEKTTMEETGYNIYHELFKYFLIPGILLLLAEILLSGTVLRRIP
ncbi:MAG: VWA domain-containing protein [Candidatus Omnitrophica bacterium]|nr:VWA domain-containing protein [Candidatus Omnitrophota bacterium]